MEASLLELLSHWRPQGTGKEEEGDEDKRTETGTGTLGIHPSIICARVGSSALRCGPVWVCLSVSQWVSVARPRARRFCTTRREGALDELAGLLLRWDG